MVIYLSGEVQNQLRLDEMTPRQIVVELDKYIVGQTAAKRAVVTYEWRRNASWTRKETNEPHGSTSTSLTSTPRSTRPARACHRRPRRRRRVTYS